MAGSILSPGTIVAGYEVDSLLGQGGMAVVYRATQRSLKRTVALKLLASELSADAGFRERFEREGQLQAAIDHLHIVPVYEAGASEHGLFLAMRLIAGGTLKELISREELDARRSLRLLAQVAQALDAAHQSGLIHRDVKPQNILIGENDHAYLADFGLIKAPGDDGLTGTGQFMGTIEYCAPEQIRGEASGPAADCYALAGVLFECLTGTVPFTKPNDMATMQAVLTEPPPRASQRRPGLPPALDEILARGLAKDPAQRPSPTAELIRSAARALAGHETSAPAAGDVIPGGGQLTRPATIPTAPSAATVASGTPAPSSPATVMSSTPTAPPAEPAAPARRGPVLATVVVLAAVAIAGGFLVGRSGREDKKTPKATPPEQLSSATAGHLQLQYPASWQVADSATPIPGITFTSPVSLRGDGGELTAGEVPSAEGPLLLAPAFTNKLQGAAPAPDRVLLGDTQAIRFTGLQGASGNPLTLFAVPVTGGAATVVCRPDQPTADFAKRCGQIAATLRIVGTDALGFTPSATYAKLLSSAFGRLRSAVGPASARLQAAKEPQPQAAAARQLANAYRTAASALRKADVSPLDRPAHRAVLDAIDGLATGYSRAGAASAAQNAASYARAQRAIRRADGALQRALKALGERGYGVTT